VQSVFRSRGLMRIISFAQIVLALVGLGLLFDTPWAWYRIYSSYRDSYYYYSVWYNAPNNAAMGLLTAGFTVLFIFVALFGLGWGWLPSKQTAKKFEKLTIVFGFLVIVFSGCAAAVIAVQETSLYPDASSRAWWLSTALTSFLVGGFLFMVIGFIGARMTRAAHVPPAPPPTPP
jgi:hypothetical protein